MATNQRSSFRVDDTLDAQLHYRGKILPCVVVNISAGGARITTTTELSRERACMVQIPVPKDLQSSQLKEDVKLHVEILDSIPTDDGSFASRLRSLDHAGSNEHESIAYLVNALQRRARAAKSGADEASPMQITEDSYHRERARGKLRISRALWNPLKRHDRDK